MKINFVYDFFSYGGRIINGIDPKYLKFLFSDNFCFKSTNINKFKSNINHDISFWAPSCLYNYDNSSDVTLPEIVKFHKSELYLYPLCTSGDLFEFLSLRTKEHKTSFYYISEKVKKLLREHDNFYIYLEHPGEPYFSSDLLNEIYKLCLKNNIPFHKIIIINGTNSNDFILSDFKEKYGIVNTPKLVSYNWAIPFKSMELRSKWGMEKNPQANNSTIANINHIFGNKQKKALLLTKRIRMHRLLLLSMLFESNSMDDILYSLDIKMNLFPNFLEILKAEPETLSIPVPMDYVDIISDGYNKLSKKKKVILDYEDFESVHGFGMETKELYENTFFSIVAETEFSKYQIAITEKVLKPIMHCHPFVVLGSPKTLKTLKTFGFKTFDKWWDESYDTEEDDWDRLYLVNNLVKSLLDKSEDDWNLLMVEMKDILEYNQNLLSTFDADYILNKIKENFTDIDTKNIITIL